MAGVMLVAAATSRNKRRSGRGLGFKPASIKKVIGGAVSMTGHHHRNTTNATHHSRFPIPSSPKRSAIRGAIRAGIIHSTKTDNRLPITSAASTRLPDSALCLVTGEATVCLSLQRVSHLLLLVPRTRTRCVGRAVCPCPVASLVPYLRLLPSEPVIGTLLTETPVRHLVH